MHSKNISLSVLRGGPTVGAGAAIMLAFAGATFGAVDARVEIQPDAHTGKAMAVVIGDVALLHTAGFMALDEKGRLVGGEDIVLQSKQMLRNIERALHAGGSSLDQLVKLNLAVREPAMCAEVEKVLAGRFAGKPKPAVTLVVSNHPMAAALVAGDAVAVAPAGSAGTGPSRVKASTLHSRGRQSHAAVLPAGSRIFFSGKGGRGPIAETTRQLMEDLRLGMNHIEVRLADIVHIRVFLKQMAETRQLEEVMEQFFGDSDCPPITYLDRESGEGAMEIEMIAAGRSADSRHTAQVEYFTPPKWKPSPVFSQIARVNRGGLIFVSGLRGAPADDAESQARTIFSRLDELVRVGGGDINQLAKALYYIAGKEGGPGMDKVRPKIFDPNRPPAASRNSLRHVGAPGGAMLVDMIGVVVEK